MDVDTLRHRLREAPFDFLSAFASYTLHAFEQEWHSLRENVDTASAMLLLNDDDMYLAHATATQIATWGELFSSTDDEAARRTASFMDEMDDVFAQLTISDVHQAASCSPTAYSKHSPRLSGVPLYIQAAYSWILQNIHDPYPPSEIKERISRDAGRPIRVITDWFKDARRYIGWVSVCKSYFEGSRARTVQAAKHVYLYTGSTSQLSPSSEIISQFEAIRTRLRDMYPSSDEGGDLSDCTDDSSLPSTSSFQRHRSDQSCYARLRSSSSTPSLVFSSDDEDNHSLASLANDAPVMLGKRKNIEGDESRPLKRNRYGFISVADAVVADADNMSSTASTTSSAPPSTSPSSQLIPSRKRRLTDASTEWEDVFSPSSSSTQCDSRPPLRMPKRRLSVSDSQPSIKRPCLPPAVGARKQAVSTPLPIAHQTTPAVDAWFPFELLDTSLSVELFNWDAVVGNDAFSYNSLFDNILQSDGFSNVTPLSDAHQSPIPLELGASAVEPSILDICSVFIEPPPTQLKAPISTLSPEPITATTTPVFDFDAFLSAVNTEPQSTQLSSSPYTELSLDDSIDIFGDLVDP